MSDSGYRVGGLPQDPTRYLMRIQANPEWPTDRTGSSKAPTRDRGTTSNYTLEDMLFEWIARKEAVEYRCKTMVFGVEVNRYLHLIDCNVVLSRIDSLVIVTADLIQSSSENAGLSTSNSKNRISKCRHQLIIILLLIK